MKNFERRMRYAILLLVLAALPSFAQITPSDDAYTNTGSPSTNFGAKPLLDVQSASQNTYILFDLSPLPAGYTGSNISKATLKLYVNTVTSAGSFNVDFVNGSWTEKTITANLAPALGTTIAASIPLSNSNAKDYIIIDVTSAVQAWLNGTQANDGLALVGNSPLNATFDSKESTTQSHPPELDIVFTSSGGGTITGINTAAGSGLIGGGNSGTLNLSLINTCANKQVLQWNGSSWVCANLSGSGTVTSVGFSAPTSDFTVSGSPVTTAGTLGLNWSVAPTSASTANAIVKRDASGGFSAGIIKATTTSSTSAVTGTTSSSATGATGVHGIDNNTAFGTFTAAVQGNTSNPTGVGVLGTSGSFSLQGQGWLGARAAGLWGDNSTGLAIFATTDSGAGLAGVADSGSAVSSSANTGDALDAFTNSGVAVSAFTNSLTTTNSTLEAVSEGEGNAIYASNAPSGAASDSNATLLIAGRSSVSHYVLYAEDYSGTRYVRTSSAGDLAATGALIGASKSFKIDHPLDPTNKYLFHTSIESPDMMNIYNGIVVLDGKGEASVALPSYFEALNKDFRYQLTAIGAPGPNLYVAEEVSGNHFLIGGGKPGAKVSWQITGIRHDAWANANRSPVEVEKAESEKGLYLHPEAFGAPLEKSVTYHNRAAGKQSLERPKKALYKTTVEPSDKR